MNTTKKLTIVALCCFVMTTLIGCGIKKENTPQGVVEYSIYCLNNHDFEGFLDCYDWRWTTGYDRKEVKLKDLQKKEEDGKFKNLKMGSTIVDDQIQEFTQQRIIKVNVTNTETNVKRTVEFHLTDVDGEWKIVRNTGLWIYI